MKYNNNKELAKIIDEASTKVKSMRSKDAQLKYLGKVLDEVQEQFQISDRHAAAYALIDMINNS